MNREIIIRITVPRWRRAGTALLVLGAVVVGSAVWAGPLGLTQFMAKTPISSTDVNNNFQKLEAAVVTLQGQVASSLAAGTSGEAFAAGAALYSKASDGRLYKAVGTSDEATYSFLGIAQDAAAGAGISGVRYARPGTIAGGTGRSDAWSILLHYRYSRNNRHHARESVREGRAGTHGHHLQGY